MLSFKIVKMTKGLLTKKCARKIVNCYRMFAELRELLVGSRALDKGERLIASRRSRPQTPSTPSSSIPARG